MPRMRSPQELLRDSRRELLSRSPRSSSPLERSEPIALMERGRTCGLFFRPLRNRPPRSNRPCNSPPHDNRPVKLVSIPHAATALRRRLARIAPYAFSFRRMHATSPLPGNVCPKCMLFEIRMARSSPYASISRCNRVVLDTWRKDLARKAPFSRRETRNHAWHEDAARAFGLQSGQKIGSPNGDPINELFGFAQRLPDALQPLHQAEELAVSCLEELHRANELAVSRLKESHQANELALSHLGGGLRKWVHRRCGLSMRFPVWRNCTRRTSLRFPAWKN